MKKVIIDASSVLILFRTGLLEPCCAVYCVFLPGCVFHEIVDAGKEGSREIADLVESGIMEVLHDPEGRAEEPELRGGEKSAVDHFRAGGYDFIILDDRKAINYCKGKGIPFINALLIPKMLCYAGMMDEDDMRSYMKRISATGRYSHDITSRADVLGKKELRLFIP